ncbi:exopolysaccharide biosynthesis protein [Blastochloris sulfoviridis]|uniref:Exopolysaccharide biosynthesis protein n=1 Tax=Blastochloris sulfoviridis TaxID=50712 RepID=A0A5M6I5F4_9HYPH|nr:exopolysaccharide biosynthesis protein [Blastochloris sulfoviridis]KAA5603393.1 exopolysaccharide biosynthesis protein [Blastochloris sulfoviridis]
MTEMDVSAKIEPPAADAGAMPISQVLRTVGEQAEGETLTIGDIVEALGDRAMAILLILFCLPNCVPVPPGVGLVFGFPMLLVAMQMVMGRHKPWLPAAVLNRRFKVKDYIRLIDVAEPRLRKVESVLKPRYTFLFSDAADRLMGAFFVLAAISVILPLPGSNFPPAIASVLMSLAMLEEDGVVLTVGLTIGSLGLIYTTLVGGAVAWAAVAASRSVLGM